MKRNILIINAVIAVVIALGCANPTIVPVGNDTYILSKEDHAGIFGSMAKLKAEVITEANRFAESKGKIAVPVSVREKPVGNSPADWATFEYQFKLVDKGGVEAKKASLNADRKMLSVRPNTATQNTQNVTADINVNNTSQKEEQRTGDIYTDLIKLDDLKKRGIINESEFQAQKAKILQSE